MVFEWLSFIRDNKWRKDLVSKLAICLFIVYLFTISLIIGVNIEDILSFNKKDNISLFNSLLIFYLLIDFIFRYWFSSFIGYPIITLLRLKFKLDDIINYLLLRNLVNLNNILPWLIIIPFSVKIILTSFQFLNVFSYLFGFLLLLIFNNYLATLIALLSRRRPIIVIFLSAFNIIVFSSNYIRSIISTVSQSIGEAFILPNIWVFLILIGLIILIVITIKRLIVSRFKVDEYIPIEKASRRNEFNLSLASDGLRILKNYIILEFKLILRNNRSIQTLSIYPIFPIYLLYQFATGNHSNTFSVIYMLTFAFGLFSLLYGQYIFSWESTYYDGILARKISLLDYISSKYYFMIISSSIIFLIFFVPIFFLKRDEIFTLISIFLFENGILNLIVLFIALFNNRRLELRDNFLFNYQGLNGHQFFIPVVILLIPISLFLLLNNFFKEETILCFYFCSGAVCILLNRFLIKSLLVPVFFIRKYNKLEGYRIQR
jgi:hypothetical protein